MKNLSIKIEIHELNDKALYDGGLYLILPIFIDKKDCSRANISYFFLKAASKLCDKLKLKDVYITNKKGNEVNEKES